MNREFEKVNNVLAEWDPLDVGRNIAQEEYKAYVPSILRVIKDKQELRYCLEDMLINRLGLEYDPTNAKDLLSLQTICDQLVDQV
ncbi:MAG: hypothetical protein AAF400_00395 [Bacteroidota bacterium]